MATNPLDYSGGNGFLQGLQGAGIYQQVQQQKAAAEQAAAAQAQAQQFQQDWQRAYSSGDPAALDAIAAKYPGQIELVQKAIGFRDDNQRMALGNAARELRIAAQSGNPAAFAQVAANHRAVLQGVGSSPEELAQQFQQDPRGTLYTIDTVGTGALGVKDYYGLETDRNKLAEQVRSNKAGESLTARGQDISAATARRGQDITARGQEISQQNSLRSAGGTVPASVREYEYVKNLSPEERSEFLKLSRGASGQLQTAQLSSGETVLIDSKPLGAGASKFYKGQDANGNVITVPVSALSTAADSSSIANQNLVNSDVNLLLNAGSGDLNKITGVTGKTGTPSITADYATRLSGGVSRELYNAGQRIQGNLQNQGIASARALGASGINTVAEAKLYFQSVPQLDFSSDDTLRKSAQNIQKYTNDFNQRTNVNYGSGPRQESAASKSVGQHTTKSGIKFEVE